MNSQFLEFKKIIRHRNEITSTALECALLVFRKAREMQPEHQKPMLEILRDLISMEKEDNVAA
jgi:hypothetical protein